MYMQIHVFYISFSSYIIGEWSMLKSLSDLSTMNKGLFKYLMIIFWPTPDTPLPPLIKCERLAYPPPLMITRYLNEYLRQSYMCIKAINR